MYLFLDKIWRRYSKYVVSKIFPSIDKYFSFLFYLYLLSTGKSLSEALIFASINPQYDNRLLMELPVQYMKTTSAEHGKNMFCPCSALVVFMCWTGNSMNNLLSYCGLVDARISASEKDIPVTT